MKQRDLFNLLARAAAALETPQDLTDSDRAELIEDLMAQVKVMTETKPIRIKHTDGCGNVSYIHNTGGQWRATLFNGIPYALSNYFKDAVAAAFALQDATTPEAALAVCQAHSKYSPASFSLT